MVHRLAEIAIRLAECEELLESIPEGSDGRSIIETRMATLKKQSDDHPVNKVHRLFQKAYDDREALKKLPAPEGYTHRCKECGEGTNRIEGACVVCAFY